MWRRIVMVVGVMFVPAAVVAASSIYGFTRVSQCRAAIETDQQRSPPSWTPPPPPLPPPPPGPETPEQTPGWAPGPVSTPHTRP